MILPASLYFKIVLCREKDQNYQAGWRDPVDRNYNANDTYHALAPLILHNTKKKCSNHIIDQLVLFRSLVETLA